MIRLNYRDILNSELQTASFTRSYFKGVNDNIPTIIDTLIQLIYFTGDKKDVNTFEGEYHSYLCHQYLQVPYSFRACFVLYEMGHYLEATFILRYLVEVLVKMRYLEKHKNLVSKVWTNKKVEIIGKNGKKKKLTLKDIFEETAPNYYSKNYGHLFSGFQHGEIGASIFRVEFVSPAKGTVRTASAWDERGATFIINNFIVICYGYLNYFPKFFPDGFKTLDSDLTKQYKSSVLWLDTAMSDHKKTHLKSINWYKEIDQLIK